MHVRFFPLLLLGGLFSNPSSNLRADDPPPKSAKLSEQYQEAAKKILDATLAGNEAHGKLEELCYLVGHRLSGSPALDKALDWAVAAFKKDGQENVRKEPVRVPRWVRGNESLVMLEPRETPVAMLGLGGSVGTPPEGITAEVLAVRDEEELKKVGEQAKGKILLFNFPMPPYDPEKGSGYGSAVHYRVHGARLAGECGAVACLIRSVTAKSLRSPHTGAMHYFDTPRRVPAAAVSVEDAEMIHRLTKRGIKVVLRLKMEAREEESAMSANVVAELRGRTNPEEIVVIGGHIDSWDVGQGAHDDGAGCVTAMEALNVLRKLNLVPRRTIRVVLWTNEENGLAGGRQYAKDHADELKNHVAAIEADTGGFQPQGFGVSVENKDREKRAAAQLEEITRLLAPIQATRAHTGGGGADIGPMGPAGVPLLSLDVEGSRYFDYHHTHADTFDKVDPKDLTHCVAAMAVMAYVLADMPGRLGDGP